MITTFTQDIYNMLCQKYPNQNIYVIGDQHFFHNNIIYYTRNNFSDIFTMNQNIIDKHNEIVSKDDIVIFLGDFCFKTEYIKDITIKLNGHKYLILGNHDSADLVKRYPNLGFEGVFLTPIKIGNKYLSHEPLIEGQRNDLQFNLILNEFKKISQKINYHGHIHDLDDKISNNYQNVTCEVLDYKPLLLCKTKKIDKNEKPLFINSASFTENITEFISKHHIQPQLIIGDYIYSMILESMSYYKDDYFVQGSYGLLKKYNLLTKFSDLDISFLYDNTISKNQNIDLFKNKVDTIYNSLKSIDNINLIFLKRYVSLRIFEALYTTKHPYFTSCILDSNLIAFDCYKKDDFIKLNKSTILQNYLQKNKPSIIEEYKFPNFQTQFLKPEGDIANLLLQIIYQTCPADKKLESLKRLRYVCKNTLLEQNVDYFSDIFSRLFLRNISFLYTVNRYDEIEYIQKQIPDVGFLSKSLPMIFYNQICDIINNPNSSFSLVRNEISNTSIDQVFDKCLTLIKSIK